MEQIDSIINNNNNLYSLLESSKKEDSLFSLKKSKQKNNNKKIELNKNKTKNKLNSKFKSEEREGEGDSIHINSLINKEINKDESLLFQKIYEQNIREVKEILKSGKNPNITNIDGITPLHIAINKKNERIIEYLLKYNANPNSKTIIDGQTPVHLAIKNNSNKKILKLLIEYGGSFNIKDNYNKTAFDYISDMEVFNNIKKLINLYKNKKKFSSDNSKENISNNYVENNNNKYNNLLLEKFNKNNDKEYFEKIDKTNNNRDLMDLLVDSSEIKFNEENNQSKNNSLNNQNNTIFSNTKSLNNYLNSDEDSSSIPCIKNDKTIFSSRFKEISNKNTKRRTNSTLSELIQLNKENNSLSTNNDINLTNIIKINTMPKIIFDNINSDIIIHKKSKSINNNNFINKHKTKNIKLSKLKPNINYYNTLNYKSKINNNNNIKSILENEKNDFLLENNNNTIINNKENLINKKIYKKRRYIPKIQKNNIKNDSIKRFSMILNLSKINKKEDFNLSKLIELNNNYSLNTNKNNSFNNNKKNYINKDLNHNNNNNNKNTFYNKYPIYYWLKDINLLSYYNLFIENNIYNFDTLILKLKNDLFSLKKEDFEKIGINTPGHIYRIITKLEVNSGKIKKDIYNFLIDQKYINSTIYSNSVEGINDSDYYCIGCFEQENEKNFSNIQKNGKVFELENWLNKIGLLKYKKNFINNGFDIFTYFILQMFSSIPIDEKIIKEELEIHNENDVDIILLQLNKEVKYILHKLEKDQINKNNNKGKEKFVNKLLIKNNSSKLDCQII